jgi:tetratricopeptide (TPR) repeat protein
MLHNESFRVFFAKISLKDHAGEKYEPYIFNALNTAKVMLVIGSKPEYFEAVWVRNEWSRYLELIKKDKTRKLIPCIKDMNPYDLPEELKNYQALNMSDMGFSQAIINIVKPYKKQSETQAPVVAAPVGDTHKIPALYKRACMFLEDGDFKKADEYFNTILDIDPEYAPAHMGKFCVSEEAREEEQLKNYSLNVDVYKKNHLTARDPMGYINVDWSDFNNTFKTDSNFRKALQYADPEQKARYEEYDEIYQQNNKNKLDIILSIREEQIAEADRQREERIRQHNEYRESQYNSALEQYNALPANYINVPGFEKILTLFQNSEGFENAENYISQINNKIDKINQLKEKIDRRNKRIKGVFLGIWAVITFILKYFVWYPVKFIGKAVWAVIKFIFNLLTGNL